VCIGVNFFALVLLLELSCMLQVLAKRATDFVLMDGEFGSVRVLGHVVVIETEFCLIHRTRKFLPMVNLKLL